MAEWYAAIYDPARGSRTGDYWTWKHPLLEEPLRDVFYYEFAAKNLPVGALTNNYRIAGVARIHPEWDCWYQFFDGGRDQFDRTGRFVICCAFLRSKEGVGQSWSGILRSEAFLKVAGYAMRATTIASLTSEAFHFTPAIIDRAPAEIKELLKNDSLILEGSDVIELAGQLAGSIPPPRRFHCKLQIASDKAILACSLISTQEPVARSGLNDQNRVQQSPTTSSAFPSRGTPRFTFKSLIGHFPPQRLLLLVAAFFLIGAFLGFLAGYKACRFVTPHGDAAERQQTEKPALSRFLNPGGM